MKFGIADYGMNVWDGGLFDIEEHLQDPLKDLSISRQYIRDAGF